MQIDGSKFVFALFFVSLAFSLKTIFTIRCSRCKPSSRNIDSSSKANYLELPSPIFRYDQVKTFVRRASTAFLSLSMTGPIATVWAQEWTDRNRLAAEAWRTVDELYVDRTFNGQDWFKLRQSVVKRGYKSDEEVYSALQDMVSKLGDKYTRYLTPAQYNALLSSTKGELVGIGVELGQEDGNTKIIRVETDSPAEAAGLQAGDIVLNVDGNDASLLSPEEVANFMRGKDGSKEGVRVRRGGKGGEGKVLDFQVTRQPIRLQGVRSQVLKVNSQGKKKDVLYISIRAFAETTKDEVQRAIEEVHLKKENIDFIVVDLRNNGGGLLQGAVDASNLFLKPGKIVVFVVNKDNQVEAKQTLGNAIISTDPELPDLSTPTAILINENTASAAEVFSAGLRENGRVKLVGEKSFGKGIIQTLQELRQGGLTVTIARYETPEHHNINKIGIEPDVPLDCKTLDTLEACVSATVNKL